MKLLPFWKAFFAAVNQYLYFNFQKWDRIYRTKIDEKFSCHMEWNEFTDLNKSVLFSAISLQVFFIFLL